MSSARAASLEAEDAITERHRAARVKDAAQAQAAAMTARCADLERTVAVALKECDSARRQFHDADEESRLLRRQNDDLVLRLVDDKQRLVTEMNAMNDMIAKLTRENQLLRGDLNDDDFHDDVKRGKTPIGGQDADHLPGVIVVDDDYASADFDDDKKNHNRWAVVGSMCGDLHLRSWIPAAHDTEINDVVVCDDDEDAVITASSDGTARRFRVVQGAADEEPVACFAGKRMAALLAVDVVAPVVATVASDRAVRLYDARSGKLKHDLENAHGGKILSCLLGSPGPPKLLATASVDRSMKIWDLGNASKLKTTLRAPSACHCLSGFHGVDVVNSGHRDGVIRAWDLRSATDPVSEIPDQDNAPVLGLARARGPTHHVVVALKRDATVHVYDDRTRGRLAFLKHSEHLHVHPSAQTLRPALAPDGRHVAVPSATGSALLFDTSTSLCASVLPHPSVGRAGSSSGALPPLTALEFSPSSANCLLAAVDKSGSLAFWGW